jgi:type VI secretion system secreted protein VgrG
MALTRLLQADERLGAGGLVLLRMSGQEELSRLSEFQLEFISPRGDIGPKEILGKNITWALELENADEPRYFNGFVTQFSEGGEATVAEFEQGRKSQAYFYRATVHPWLWFLTRASDCRIFLKKSVVQIAEEVFQKYDFGVVDRRLKGTYPEKDFCVQYRETDFNFVCRLFEQEGIYFAFEYADGGHTLVLMDSPGTHVGDPLEVAFNSESHLADHLSAWDVNREIQPGEYAIEDFDYINPRNKLVGKRIDPKKHDLAGFQMYDYPGEYVGLGEGTRYAQTRMEELHARYEQFSGSGNVRLSAPGALLKLMKHKREQYNADYLITSVSYTASVGELSSGGEGADFHCSLAAIAASVAFRPARITPKPTIQGPQTAIVVGESGDEICTDEHGRIKVQFHWDRYSERDGNSSCWVRVAQPLAGSGWGFLALPRVGHEVVVEFLEGDPDRPLVTGSVYNGELKPPYDLPKEKTRSGVKTLSSKGGSSSNFNELRFEDEKGEEEIYIHAEKDKAIRIKNDRLEWVGKTSHLIVGDDRFEKMGADHHITVKNRNEKLEGSLSLDIGQDLHGKVGNLLAYDAGKEIHLKAGTTIVLESGTKLSLKVGGNFVDVGPKGVSIKGTAVVVEAAAQLSLKVGGNFVDINPAGVFIKGTMVMINTGGAAGSADAAGTGSGAKPEKPKPPQEAGTSKGGKMTEPPEAVPPEQYKPQAQMFAMAAQNGTPFCQICNH